MLLERKKCKYGEKYESTKNISHFMILRLFYNIAVKCTKNGFTILHFSLTLMPDQALILLKIVNSFRCILVVVFF